MSSFALLFCNPSYRSLSLSCVVSSSVVMPCVSRTCLDSLKLLLSFSTLDHGIDEPASCACADVVVTQHHQAVPRVVRQDLGVRCHTL